MNNSGETKSAVASSHTAATARTLVGFSIEGAAEALGMPAMVLREIEAGELTLNDELKVLMEKTYGMSLDGLAKGESTYVPRTPVSYDSERKILRVGSLGVRFDHHVDDNDVLLRGFSSAVRRQRQTPPSVPLMLRRVDLPVLSELLDLDDPELDERARFWFGQTAQTAQSFSTMLHFAQRQEQGADVAAAI